MFGNKLILFYLFYMYVMTDKNRLLHTKHAEELIKLSDQLDDLNMNNKPYKSIVDNSLDYKKERTERNAFYRKKNTNILANLDKFYYNVASLMYKNWRIVPNHILRIEYQIFLLSSYLRSQL